MYCSLVTVLHRYCSNGPWFKSHTSPRQNRFISRYFRLSGWYFPRWPTAAAAAAAECCDFSGNDQPSLSSQLVPPATASSGRCGHNRDRYANTGALLISGRCNHRAVYQTTKNKKWTNFRCRARLRFCREQSIETSHARSYARQKIHGKNGCWVSLRKK